MGLAVPNWQPLHLRPLLLVGSSGWPAGTAWCRMRLSSTNAGCRRILDLGEHGIRLLDFDQLAWTVFGGEQGALAKVYGYGAGQKTVHRAEADARDLAAAWRAGLGRARSD